MTKLFKTKGRILYLVFLLSFSVFLTFTGFTQDYINAYAKVTAVNTGTKTLTLGTSAGQYDYTKHSFVVGAQVMIWQVQDDVIGANTSNNSSFGDLSSIKNAGIFEVATIVSISTAVNGRPNGLTLDKIDNTYNIGGNTSVQVISIPHFVNYTTTSDLTALAWNGNIGGALIMVVDETLTLKHDINVDEKGFRGGNPGYNTSTGACSQTQQDGYIFNSSNYGAKGEGIYKSTTVNQRNRRGKILTGGGGGNYHNAGGGGGGNFSAGGLGGNGWGGGAANNGLCQYQSGGIGGIALEGYIAPDRLFLGGGGGGGQGNESPTNQATKGANGGGAIFIQANKLVTPSGLKKDIFISANGESAAPTSGNDGGGGGGAGGTIVFNINVFDADKDSPLAISADGADGSTVTHTDAHGGGGAGAQGVVVFSIKEVPTENISVTTKNGKPGLNCLGCTGLPAGSASNVDNKGIFTFWTTPLPVDLVYFRANKINNEVAHIDWATSMEINASHFTVLKSNDGIEWREIEIVNAKGNSNEYNTYGIYDLKLNKGKNIYKLIQTDIDGVSEEKSIASVIVPYDGQSFTVSPNPGNGEYTLSFSDDVIKANIEIFDMMGKKVYSSTMNSYSVNLTLPPNKGIYLLKVDFGTEVVFKKILNQ